MRRSLFAALFASALGCPRAVPDHLRIDETPEGSAATAPITDVKAALATIVGRDPLARSPVLLDPNVLEELPGGDPLAAFVRQVRTAELRACLAMKNSTRYNATGTEARSRSPESQAIARQPAGTPQWF